MDDQPTIFLSYASPDRDRVMQWYAYLKGHNLNPWIDKKNLIGGQNWDYEIRKALNQCDLIVLFISRNSTNKQGYVQREIRLALTKFEERIFGEIYIIPVLLDSDAQIPDQISDIQCLDASDPDFSKHLLDSIRHQFKEAKLAQTVSNHESEISWYKENIHDSWNGLPGYSFEGELLHLSSGKFPGVSDCTQILRGWLYSHLLSQRRTALWPDANLNFGKPREIRTNTWGAFCADPIIKGRVLSIKYEVSWYGAGAAHENYGYKTFNFFLDPVCSIESLGSLFNDPNSTFEIIRTSIVDQLMQSEIYGGDDDQLSSRKEWISNGITDYKSIEYFIFSDTGVQFLFPPYQVSSFAEGYRTATVPYELLMPYFTDLAVSYLGAYHL